MHTPITFHSSTFESKAMKHEDEYQAMRNLEVGDDVDDDIIEAFNTLIHGPRHVKHQGRPREGDKVGFIIM